MCRGRREVKIVNGSLNTLPWAVIKLIHVVMIDIGRCDSRGVKMVKIVDI
jgi:hypothetical protein